MKSKIIVFCFKEANCQLPPFNLFCANKTIKLAAKTKRILVPCIPTRVVRPQTFPLLFVDHFSGRINYQNLTLLCQDQELSCTPKPKSQVGLSITSFSQKKYKIIRSSLNCRSRFEDRGQTISTIPIRAIGQCCYKSSISLQICFNVLISISSKGSTQEFLYNRSKVQKILNTIFIFSQLCDCGNN